MFFMNLEKLRGSKITKFLFELGKNLEVQPKTNTQKSQF